MNYVPTTLLAAGLILALGVIVAAWVWWKNRR